MNIFKCFTICLLCCLAFDILNIHEKRNNAEIEAGGWEGVGDADNAKSYFELNIPN